MKIQRQNILYKRLSLSMAVFMLIGQFAFFHLHLHLDRGTHQKSISCGVSDRDDKMTYDNESIVETESHFHCEVCDLYLSKKLDLPKSFSFSFIKDDFELLTVSAKSFFSNTAQFTPLRAPPVKYA